MTAVKQNRRIFLYEICSIHISVAEDSGTSGCDAVSTGGYVRKFKRKLLPHLSEQIQPPSQ